MTDAPPRSASSGKSLETTYLDSQSIRSWIRDLGITSPDAQKTIVEAWAAVGRSARRARVDLPKTGLGQIEFGPHSPTASSGLPPTISAADFRRVMQSKRQRGYVKRWQPTAMKSPATEVCFAFLDSVEVQLSAA